MEFKDIGHIQKHQMHLVIQIDFDLLILRSYHKVNNIAWWSMAFWRS